jgi:hypothetical protein
MPSRPARRLRSPGPQNASPSAIMTACEPSVTHSKNTWDTPRLDLIEHAWPNSALIAPGHSRVMTVTTA